MNDMRVFKNQIISGKFGLELKWNIGADSMNLTHCFLRPMFRAAHFVNKSIIGRTPTQTQISYIVNIDEHYIRNFLPLNVEEQLVHRA